MVSILVKKYQGRPDASSRLIGSVSVFAFDTIVRR
jgi:hypothetical protein